jgi:hypothetical protein
MVKRQSTRKTRKVRATKARKQIQTIPQLRKAFDHMEKVVERLKKSSKQPLSDAVDVYREEWRKTFKRDLSPAEASSYLKFRLGVKGSRAITRRSRMRGGMAVAPLAGAPLDYQTRPGVDGVYGNFPTHQTAGLDRYYGSAMTASCGKGQAGGAWSDGLFRPLIPGAPVSTAYDAMMSVKGVGPSSSSDPVGLAPTRSMPSLYIPPGNVTPNIRTVPPSY